MHPEIEFEDVCTRYSHRYPGVLCHLVLQKIACGDAAFTTASEVTGQTTSRLHSRTGFEYDGILLIRTT